MSKQNCYNMPIYTFPSTPMHVLRPLSNFRTLEQYLPYTGTRYKTTTAHPSNTYTLHRYNVISKII